MKKIEHFVFLISKIEISIENGIEAEKKRQVQKKEKEKWNSDQSDFFLKQKIFPKQSLIASWKVI